MVEAAVNQIWSWQAASGGGRWRARVPRAITADERRDRREKKRGPKVERRQAQRRSTQTTPTMPKSKSEGRGTRSRVWGEDVVGEAALARLRE